MVVESSTTQSSTRKESVQQMETLSSQEQTTDLLAERLDGMTLTQDSTVQKSEQVSETVVRESSSTVDGVTSSVVEGAAFSLSTKDGEVVSHDLDEFREETVHPATGTETLLAEADDHVAEGNQQEKEDDKAKGIQGLKESLEDSFEIIKPDSPSGSEPQALSSSDEDEEDSSPASPRSPSPKVSPGSPKRSSHSSGSSSGASSHGSSHEDLGDLKDRELLDEMIVKDVPEVSTDPVRQFEDSNHSSNPIDSIPEDTDQLENQ